MNIRLKMKNLLRFFVFICCVISSVNFQSYAQNITTCKVFPSNNIWNTSIQSMPLHPKSSNYINTIGASLSLRNDFGSGLWNDAPIGIPYILVDGNQKKQMVTFEYADESDNVSYPIPNNPPIEGGINSTGDRHILMIDTTNCILYELYSAYQNNDGTWRAGSGAVFDLNSNTLRPDTWTSADAAGLPIYPGLVKYDEMASGEIKHAIRFTVPKTQRAYLWPARHYASSIKDENYPPMGVIMRLKKSFDMSKLSPQSKVIAIALQNYGMILADNGSAWYMSGVPDERWDMDDLYTLRQIKGSDFEAVDVSSLMKDPNSGEVKDLSNSVENEKEISEINYTIEGENLHLNALKIGSNIAIYDYLGNVLIRKTIQNENEIIDISQLKTGIYFMNIGKGFSRFWKFY